MAWFAWLSVTVLVLATGAIRAGQEAGAFEVILDLDGMAYHEKAQAVVRHIEAGDFASAEQEIAVLRTLERPQAVFVATMHQEIGFAYGGVGRFEPAIVHIEESLQAETDAIPELAEASHAYLVYANAALGRFDEAERLLATEATAWPWLLAKLASLYADKGRYDCAVALGERALGMVRAGERLWPWPVATHDRDAALQEWSDRLEAARQAERGQAAGSPTGSLGMEPRICLGAKHARTQAPEQGR